MPISDDERPIQITITDYKQPDLFNIQRLMCPHCGLIFDFQFPLDDEPLGWPSLSDEPYYSETYFDDLGNPYEIIEKTPNITKNCRRCGLEIKEDTLILINISKLINFDDIRTIIKDGEGENLELKLQMIEKIKLAKIIGSFANKRGGTIIIGVDDKSREIEGIENLSNHTQKETIIAEVKNAQSNIQPQPQYHLNFIEDNNKIILVITIPVSRYICYVRGKVPIREGHSSESTNDPAKIANLREYRKQTYNFDE